MDLNAQIQLLIKDAPQDGITPRLVTAIAPVLLAIAQTLRHSQYYILQSPDGEWVMTTIGDRQYSQVEKQVIYAFPNLQDAFADSGSGFDPQYQAVPILVTHLLFQLLALEPVDSIVFFETSGINPNAVEVKRTDMQNFIQQQLQPQPFDNQVPPDIA